MTRTMKTLACSSAVAITLIATGAQAQNAPDSATVLSRACENRAGQIIDRADLAEALLSSAGISPGDVAGSQPIPAANVGRPFSEVYDEALVAGVRAILSPTGTPAWRTAVAPAVRELQDRLAVDPGDVIFQPAGQRVELFAAGPQAWQIRCKPEEDDGSASTPAPERDRPTPPRFAIRATPEELWLTDASERRKAGAFTLGFERTRTILEDGTRKSDTSFTVDGTVGLRLTRPGDFQVFLFATYDLQRDRTRPAPTLDPDESESDGDTHALALGFDGAYSCADLCWIGFPMDVNFQASTIFDFANDASRLRLRAIFTPRFEWPLGICNLNGFNDGPLRGRCELAGEVQYAHVIRRGTTELGNFDNFAAIGGRLGIEFFLPTRPGDSPDTGFFASARYRYLPVIHGAPDHIERFEGKIGHRFWTGANVGVDVGFTYTRGTNELSFEEENKLTFGLGLIF